MISSASRDGGIGGLSLSPGDYMKNRSLPLGTEVELGWISSSLGQNILVFQSTWLLGLVWGCAFC